MVTKQTFAVVLNVADHGESDKIVTIYCPDHGKLTGIAKGAKRSKKRFVNKLELFSLLNITYSNTRGALARIDQAELLDSFQSLRKNYHKYSAAILLCELMLCWTKENDGDPEISPLAPMTKLKIPFIFLINHPCKPATDRAHEITQPHAGCLREVSKFMG